MSRRTPFQRHVALPADHGSWAFFVGPLLIGLCAGGELRITALYLTVAASCGFLIRQPVTLVVKALSGRRSREVLPAAWFWIAVYTTIGLLHVVGLVLRGFGYVLYLAIPGVPVFFWYLLLVARRAERRQWLLEILAAGVMALVAPAAMWVGLGRPDPTGWVLWLLVWSQLITAILLAYLRLEQRGWGDGLPLARRMQAGKLVLVIATVCVLGVAAAGTSGVLPTWLFIPYGVQWAEVLRGVIRPAIGQKPRAIGFRQLGVSTLFTLLFIVAWTAG